MPNRRTGMKLIRRLFEDFPSLNMIEGQFEYWGQYDDPVIITSGNHLPVSVKFSAFQMHYDRSKEAFTLLDELDLEDASPWIPSTWLSEQRTQARWPVKSIFNRTMAKLAGRQNRFVIRIDIYRALPQGSVPIRRVLRALKYEPAHLPSTLRAFTGSVAALTELDTGAPEWQTLTLIGLSNQDIKDHASLQVLSEIAARSRSLEELSVDYVTCPVAEFHPVIAVLRTVAARTTEMPHLSRLSASTVSSWKNVDKVFPALQKQREIQSELRGRFPKLTWVSTKRSGLLDGHTISRLPHEQAVGIANILTAASAGQAVYSTRYDRSDEITEWVV